MRVDAHHHLWNLAVRPQPWIDPIAMSPLERTFTLDDLRPEIVAAGVDATVVVQSLHDEAETAEHLALADHDPAVAGVVGWTDLTAAPSSLLEQVARLRELPGGASLVGVRHLLESEPNHDWLDRQDVRAGLRTLADAGLAYDLLTRPGHLPAAINAVRAAPATTFVLDHLSKPPINTGALEPWAALLKELAHEPNVFCKLSGMVTETGPGRWTTSALQPYVDLVLETFGPSRTMFGSDWPVCLLAASYGEVIDAASLLTAGLSASERDDVFGATALRAYGLADKN